MKMKNSIIVSSFMALALLCSCVPDHRDAYMPDSAVYFTDNTANKGVQHILMYDVQSEVEAPVYVHCAGLHAGNANVTARVAEDYIDYYNKVNYTAFKALPANCYTLTKSADELSGRTAAFAVSFNVPNIIAFSKEDGVDLNDYVLALGLDADNLPVATVKDTTSLGYYMVSPILRNATLQIKSTGLTPDGNMTITAELPFENSWDLTYDVEFAATDVKELYTTRGNRYPAKYVFADKFPEGTVIENKDIKSMSAGTNKVEYSISIPAEGLVWAPGKAFNYAVKFSNAVLNGKEIPIENPLLTASVNVGIDVKGSNGNTALGTRLAEYGLTRSTTSRAAAAPAISWRTSCPAADSSSTRRRPKTSVLWRIIPCPAPLTTGCPTRRIPGCRTGAGTVTTATAPPPSPRLTGSSSTCRRSSTWAVSSTGPGPTAATT
jgi:Domain of unknown function (DUF1735).